jgi:hypothetical protein
VSGETWRIINIVLSAAGVVLMMTYMIRLWSKVFSPPVVMGVVGLLLAVWWSTLSGLRAGIPFNPASRWLSLALMFIDSALAYEVIRLYLRPSRPSHE